MTIYDVHGAAHEEAEPWVTYVGRTKVFSDRMGPYRFIRGGVEVPCVCDPDEGITCQYHLRMKRRAEHLKEAS